MWDKLREVLKAERHPAPPSAYREGDGLYFYGFTDGSIPSEPGAAGLVIENQTIHTYGVMKNRTPGNKAKNDNEETWLSGDVFELFFQLPGHRDYYEMHTTPEGIRLQLHIPDYRNFRGIPHKQKVCEIQLQVKNKIDFENHFWYAEHIIPFSGLGITSAEELRFVFVRYNRDGKNTKPEITSTMVFPTTAHYPPLWHNLVSER